jgi:hypothetical protein
MCMLHIKLTCFWQLNIRYWSWNTNRVNMFQKRKNCKTGQSGKAYKTKATRKKYWRPDQIETVIKSEQSQLRHVPHCRQWVQVRRFRKSNLQPKSWYSLCTVPAVLWANASRFPHCLNFRGFVAQLYGSKNETDHKKNSAPTICQGTFFYI